MNGEWNVIWFAVIVFAGAFYLVNLTFPVVALAYYEEVRLAALVSLCRNFNVCLKNYFYSTNIFLKKEQEAEKDLVFDIKTLKAKMAQRQKELEEYERLHPKADNPDNHSNSSDEDKITEGIAPQNTDGQFKDDSDTANIADIKLSENLGGFNSVIEEGGPTARIYFPFFKL